MELCTGSYKFLLDQPSNPQVAGSIPAGRTSEIVGLWSLLPSLSRLGCAGLGWIFKGDVYPISLILTDLHMPGGGREYLATLRRETATCLIIVITGLGGGDTIRQATLLAGATVFLEKPFGRSSSERS